LWISLDFQSRPVERQAFAGTFRVRQVDFWFRSGNLNPNAGQSPRSIDFGGSILSSAATPGEPK
jgi:hypothetical protein